MMRLDAGGRLVCSRCSGPLCPRSLIARQRCFGAEFFNGNGVARRANVVVDERGFETATYIA